MKQYDLSLQRKNIWCVPSCIQAILRYENQEISQEKIYKKLEKLESGFVLINHKKTKKFLLKRGFEFEYYNYNQTPFNEPDMLLKEMSEKNNHGIIGENSHAYLFIEFNDPDLKLLDPKNGSVIEKNLLGLLMEMNEKFGGGFGLVKKIC